MMTPNKLRSVVLNGMDLGTDFHALRADAIWLLLEQAHAERYRSPRNTNGSRARYYFYYLLRRANRTEETHGTKA